MQLRSTRSYRKARCHVVPDVDSDPPRYHNARCGRMLPDSESTGHSQLETLVGMTMIICDKCWVELTPQEQDCLRSYGCKPIHKVQNRPLKWPLNERAKKV